MCFLQKAVFFKHVFSEIKENNFFTIFHEMSDLAQSRWLQNLVFGRFH